MQNENWKKKFESTDWNSIRSTAMQLSDINCETFISIHQNVCNHLNITLVSVLINGAGPWGVNPWGANPWRGPWGGPWGTITQGNLIEFSRNRQTLDANNNDGGESRHFLYAAQPLILQAGSGADLLTSLKRKKDTLAKLKERKKSRVLNRWFSSFKNAGSISNYKIKYRQIIQFKAQNYRFFMWSK